MRTVVAVGVAGFFGAITRYGLEGFVSSKTGGSFPWGTFVVNISGSLLLGFLFAVLIEGRVVVVPWLRTAMTVGSWARTRRSPPSHWKRSVSLRRAPSGSRVRTPSGVSRSVSSPSTSASFSGGGSR
jgi:CrcB-like protein, Camphor Resistance (CrcB)